MVHKRINYLFYLCLIVMQISLLPISQVKAYTLSGYCYDSISEAGKYSDTAYLSNLYMKAPSVYLFTPDKGIIQLDISNQTNPFVRATLSKRKTVEAMAHTGDQLYAAAGSEGLLVLDISSSGIIRELAVLDTPGWASDVAISNNNIFLADGADGLRIYDISNPSAPVENSHLELEGYASRIKIHNNYAYISQADKGLSIVDITNPSQPTLVSRYTTLSPVLDVSFSQSSNLVLAAGYHGVAICTLSGDTRLSLINRNQLDGYARRVLWSGNYLYVSDFNGGLKVLEAKTPGRESVVVEVSGHQRAMSCADTGDYLYLVSGSDGLNILTKPSPLQNVKITLNGDSTKAVWTDSNGYYQFSNLTLGTYWVVPTRDPDLFYPTGSIVEPLTSDTSGFNFKRSLWQWSFGSGLFNAPGETASWSYEKPSDCTGLPDIDWSPFVNGGDGNLALIFTGPNQGIKITAKPRVDFINPSSRIGSIHYRISSDTYGLIDSFKYSLMGFNGWTSYNYREILSNKYDVKTAWGTAWLDFWLPFRSNTDSGIVQLEFRNKNTTGWAYLNVVDINNNRLYQNNGAKSFPGGEFSNSSDLQYWQVEPNPEATTGLPSINWVSQLDDQTGLELIRFTQPGKGVRLVLKNPYTLATATEETAGAFMVNLQVRGTGFPNMKVHAIQYGDSSATGYSNDTGEYFSLGNLAPGKWETIYVPLISSGALKRHLALEFLYTGNDPIDLYLDNARWVSAPLNLE